MDFADHNFKRVLSSLVFHHLTPEHKCLAATEIFRVLKPGGELNVADWGKAQNALMALRPLLKMSRAGCRIIFAKRASILSAKQGISLPLSVRCRFMPR